MKKTFETLSKGDYIAFRWTYNGERDEIIVDQITEVCSGLPLCHFLYGHHSMSQFVEKDDLLAIGNMDGDSKIRGWGGKYDIIQPNHPLIVENSYKNTESA